ncbi:MAG: hypothetical protein WBP64_05885 [Nitrososphaeraceae archaeon]
MIQCLIDSDIPIRLACLSTSDWPVVVSLWYIYSGEKFYCATQNTAKIVKYLRCSPKCGFEIAGDRFPYRGIRGYGKASILKDKGEVILRLLVQNTSREKKLQDYINYCCQKNICKTKLQLKSHQSVCLNGIIRRE